MKNIAERITQVDSAGLLDAFERRDYSGAAERRALAKMSAMVEARTSKPIAPASTSSVAAPQPSRMVK